MPLGAPVPQFLFGRYWRAFSTMPSIYGKNSMCTVSPASKFANCPSPVSAADFSSELAWHTHFCWFLQAKSTRAFSFSLLQVHGWLRKTTFLLVGTVPSLEFCIQVRWSCKTVLRLIYLAKWNKQCSSGYENLLLFFSPNVPVCLHVLTGKLTKSLCWFLCLYTWVWRCCTSKSGSGWA